LSTLDAGAPVLACKAGRDAKPYRMLGDKGCSAKTFVVKVLVDLTY